ncbi:hypothetical protein QJQ45_021242 [Haematococcus lacustris]|nr:hypothetical protein QJQ45_021242 [Haematococcus lacustris]
MLPGAGGAEEGEDEAEWAYAERRRLWKDRARLGPVILAGRGGGAEAVAAAGRECGVEGTAWGGLAAPLAVWGAERPGFESLGGLPHVVDAMRSLALLPLQYPDLMQAMGIDPPRGILFHGVAGSGKTSAVRALAGELAKQAPRPVAFYVRKGADCLGKYVGDAERTLRLLFDDVHASVVSTLLSLMDGVAERGHVLVIAATNSILGRTLDDCKPHVDGTFPGQTTGHLIKTNSVIKG